MMYNLLKKIFGKVIPSKLLFEQEENLRRFFAIFYSGKKFQCNVCQKELRTFVSLSNSDSLCPNCGSLMRNRRLWQLLEAEFLKTNTTVLDFSPSRCLYRKLKKSTIINYNSTDLSGDFIADYQYDITNLKIDDQTFDLIICYHILEHIIDDKKAMQELYRVMKFGAKALIQTPFKDGEIYEDFTIISEEGRLLHFGQEDHVRIYSVLGLRNRLEQVGFEVEIRADFNDQNKYCFDNLEKILVITKPLHN